MRYNKSYRKSRKSRSNYSKKVSKRRYSRKRGSGVFGCDNEIEYKGAYAQHVDVGCRQKTQKVIVRRSVRTIGIGAFQWFKSLKSINLPKGLRTIEGSAFNGCTSLSVVTFPNSLRKIYNGAFLNCPNLKIKNFHNKIEIEKEYEGFPECVEVGIKKIFDDNIKVEVESPNGKKEYKSIKDIKIKLFSISPCRR